MRCLALAVCLGNCLITLGNFRFSITFYLCACLITLISAIFLWRPLFLLFILLIISYTTQHFLENYQASLIPHDLEAKNLEGIIEILDPVSSEASVQSFTADLSAVSTWPGHHRISLSWFRDAPNLRVGQRWKLTVRLKRPHSLKNPGLRDKDKWFAAHGITARGYVRPNSPYKLIAINPHYYLQRLRENLMRGIARTVKHSEFVGLIQGLTVGITQDMSQSQWQVLRNTGTSHLLAISGLHIGLVFSLAWWIGQWCWRRSSWACLRMSAPQAGLVFAMAGAIFYAALAGFAVSTERSLIMLAVLVVTRWRQTGGGVSYSLSAALLIILLWDPLATWSYSFWLSFAAVGSLAYGMTSAGRLTASWQRFLCPQLVVTLLLIPLSLFFFQQASLVSILANCIAIPWVSFSIVPLCLLAASVPFFGFHLFHLAAFLFKVLWMILSRLAMLPHSQLMIPLTDPWIFAFACIAMLLLTAPRALPNRRLAFLYLLPCFFGGGVTLRPGEFRLSILDVGQGLSVVVETKQHTLVFDTGPKFGPVQDAGASVLVPYLRASWIHKVDRLIISHGDSDHTGGRGSLLASMPVQAYEPCVAGKIWEWDGVRFEILHPDAKKWDKNNGSCVLKISGKKYRVLLPGDIEKPAEIELVEKYGDQLHADILVAAHHGSRTSSTADFIDAVKPALVIFSTGYLNRYHFPNAKVLARLQERAIKTYDTGTSGAYVSSPLSDLRGE